VKLTSLALALVLVLGPSIAVADVSINDSDTIRSHDCTTDPEVALNASGVTLDLTGACTKVAINGSGTTVTIASGVKVAINGASNTVTIDAADKIAVNGAGNTVTYKRGVSKKKPKVSNLGVNNKIARVK
jgi:hypothetical protein